MLTLSPRPLCPHHACRIPRRCATGSSPPCSATRSRCVAHRAGPLSAWSPLFRALGLGEHPLPFCTHVARAPHAARRVPSPRPRGDARAPSPKPYALMRACRARRTSTLRPSSTRRRSTRPTGSSKRAPLSTSCECCCGRVGLQAAEGWGVCLASAAMGGVGQPSAEEGGGLENRKRCSWQRCCCC